MTLCLDFVNTVSWDDELSEERLRSASDLARWCRERGLPPARNLRDAKKLRATLHAIFLWTAAARAAAFPHDGRKSGRSRYRSPDIFVKRMQRHMRLVPGERKWQWQFRDALAAITWDAVSLLTSDALARVRCCSNDRCKWIFVDDSRRGNRRWCDMNICGSRAKSRAYYARKVSRRRGARPQSATKSTARRSDRRTRSGASSRRE